MSQVAEPPASELTFVPTQDLDEATRRYVQRRREMLSATVPRIPEPEVMHSWTLMKGDAPVGTFTATPYPYFGKQLSEVGLRVWLPSRGVMEVGRNWVFDLLNYNDHLIGQVFPDNKAVKKLLQAIGFQLTGYSWDLDGRVLEVYKIERGQVVGPRPKDIQRA